MLFARLDPRGRGRIQVAAELPLLFAMRKKDAPPKVSFPAEEEGTEAIRRSRQPLLAIDPFRVESIGEEIPNEVRSVSPDHAVCSRVESGRIAHGLLILKRLAVQQEEALATLLRVAQPTGAVENATFEGHVEAWQVAWGVQPSPAQIVDAEATFANYLHQTI